MLKKASKNGVKRHDKRYIGGSLINTGLTCIRGGVPLFTNGKKVVKISKHCHSVCAASWGCSHNIAELPFLICDCALFGEYVPSCEPIAYNIFSKDVTDGI